MFLLLHKIVTSLFFFLLPIEIPNSNVNSRVKFLLVWLYDKLEIVFQQKRREQACIFDCNQLDALFVCHFSQHVTYSVRNSPPHVRNYISLLAVVPKTHLNVCRQFSRSLQQVVGIVHSHNGYVQIMLQRFLSLKETFLFSTFLF